MSKEILASRNTSDILSDIRNKNSAGDHKYEETQILLKRWRQGIDLEFLEELINSEISSDRIFASYCVGELGKAIDNLEKTVLRLSADAIPECRKAFVEYIMNSRSYDEAISSALCRCLLDLHLGVRVSVMKWAVNARQEIFSDFARLVESGMRCQKTNFRKSIGNDFWNEANSRRARRGLDIVHRIRSGEKASTIRTEFPEEDSFVFDSFEFAQTRSKRLEKLQEKTAH